jgi:hypothetical protein
MTISAFAVMNPIATMAMIDIARWRPVVYANTPRTLARYKQFLDNKKPDNRKNVLFLFGASYLNDVLQNKDKFNSILVFDDMQNLDNLRSYLQSVQIVDIENQGYPRYLSPSEVMDVVNKPTNFPPGSVLLSQVTKALGPRKPSVLETTSRLPVPEAIPESGAQRMLADLKRMLGNEETPFAAMLDVYVKYLFRIINRSQVTKDITKKLPPHTKEMWKQALDFADSPVGESMAKAYHALCRTSDPDLKASHVLSKFGIKAYGGDFLYFISVLPPHHTCTFLVEVFGEDSKEPQPLVRVIDAPAVETKDKKAKVKSARAKK